MLTISILLILFSNAVSSKRDKSILYSRQAIIVMIYSIIIAVNVYNLLENSNISLYNGLYSINVVTQSFDIFLFVIGLLIIQLNGFSHDTLKVLKIQTPGYNIVEYSLILIFVILGATLIMSSCNIVSLFLSIELQSFGLYILSTMHRNSESSTTAGLTYFLLGALSSCFILLGSAFLYASFGTTDLESYYIINTIYNIPGITENMEQTNNVINISLILISVGLLFKISAAPFHFWSPDVYDSVPTIVTTFIAIVAKISILILLYQIVNYVHNPYTELGLDWKFVLIISSYMSLIVGTVLGLTETRIKRLLAYSTISHLGFILLALAIKSANSNQAFLFYLIQYSLSSLNIFIIILIIGHSNQIKTIKGYSPIQFISQLKSYYSVNPVLALCLIITLLSLVGVPPLLGFFAKQMVLSSALENNYISISLLAVLTSVISGVYYLNIIKSMYFGSSITDDNQDKMDSNNKISISSAFSLTVSIITLYLLVFIFNANNLLNVVQIIALNVNEFN